MLDWPPKFTLRKSAKAKRASIRINMYRHVEVVVPARTRFFDPIALLNEHKVWVVKQLSKTPAPVRAFEMPDQISFPAFDRLYRVIYSENDSACLMLRRQESDIMLSGNLIDIKKIQVKLITWLNQEADQYLFPIVQHLNQLHGFTAKDLKLRFMRTQWGSCNRAGKITLNSQLVFFPLPLIHHVILHELCHTKYMSHGPRFWGLLNKLDPLTEQHNKALSQSHQYLPNWVV